MPRTGRISIRIKRITALSTGPIRSPLRLPLTSCFPAWTVSQRAGVPTPVLRPEERSTWNQTVHIWREYPGQGLNRHREVRRSSPGLNSDN